jgi:hypothetical protein
VISGPRLNWAMALVSVTVVAMLGQEPQRRVLKIRQESGWGRSLFIDYVWGISACARLWGLEVWINLTCLAGSRSIMLSPAGGRLPARASLDNLGLYDSTAIGAVPSIAYARPNQTSDSTDF